MAATGAGLLISMPTRNLHTFHISVLLLRQNAAKITLNRVNLNAILLMVDQIKQGIYEQHK